MTLILDNNIIECRKTNGYINADGKLFGHWYSIESTKKLFTYFLFSKYR